MLLRKTAYRSVGTQDAHKPSPGLYRLKPSQAMKAVVLAAGAGSRMGRLSSEAPKALMPVLGVPMLEWTTTALQSAGVEEIWVNGSRWAEKLSEECARLSGLLGCSIMVSDEGSKPLGTSGALSLLKPNLTEPFFLINSDILSDIDLGSLWDAHAASGAAITLATVPGEVADIAVEDGWVTQFLQGAAVDGGLTFAGISVIDPSVLSWVPSGYSSLRETVLEQALQKGVGVAAFDLSGYWSDTGTPKRYLDSNLDALAGKLDGVLPTSVARRGDRSNYLGGRVDSVIDGSSEIRHCVISAGATIDPGAALERCVVWKSAHVRKGKYRDLILGAKARVSAL